MTIADSPGVARADRRPWTRRTRAISIDRAAGRLADAALEVALIAFALWTLLYHLALVLHIRPSAVLIGWLPVTLVLIALRATTRVRRVVPVLGGSGHLVVLALSTGAAVLASLMVRPDLDDASYVVRSTWVAERNDLGTGDVVFSHGVWGALVGQDPYLPSFEALLGAVARAIGISSGSTVYLVWVPAAAFAAVWALWMLLRSWRLRFPLLGLLLAVVLLLWGGAVHASWGNLHLGRIWQGKVVLLAIVVPATYAWCAAYWRSTSRRRSGSLALVAAAGVAAVGLSPAGVFVLPEVAVVGAVVGVLARRPGRALLLAGVGCAYPLTAGLVTRLFGNVGEAANAVGPMVNPWVRTLGDGVAALVVGAAAVLAVVGWVLPRCSGITSPTARVTAAASVLAGGLIGLPPVYDVLTGLMGTDAIAWRTMWVVPVPALVAAAVSMVRARLGAGLVAVGVAAALVVGGVPVWSPLNGARLTAQPQWKMSSSDLATARWLADEAPRAGRFLARTPVVAATGVMTTELLPVGSRLDYLMQYEAIPSAEVATRTALQQWVDGGPGTADPQVLAGLLDDLDVQVVCAVGDRELELGPQWAEATRTQLDTCWTR